MNNYGAPSGYFENYPYRFYEENRNLIEMFLGFLEIAGVFLAIFLFVYYRRKKPNFLWAGMAAGLFLIMAFAIGRVSNYETAYKIAGFIHGELYAMVGGTHYEKVLGSISSLLTWFALPATVAAAYLSPESEKPSKIKKPRFNVPKIPIFTKAVRLVNYTYNFLSYFLEVFVVRIAGEVSLNLSTPDSIKVAKSLFLATFLTIGLYGYFLGGISITFALVSLAFMLLMIIVFIFGKGASPSAVKHDVDTVSDSDFINKVNSFMSKPSGVWSGSLNGRDLFVSCQDRAVVIGPPGTGKTSFLVSQLLKWAESGRSFVCLDIKPEIYGITRAALEAKGYRLLTYNPTSSTGQRYNPISDLDSPESVGELAAALVPADSPEYAVFFESARDILDGLISHLRAAGDQVPTLPDVRDFLSQCDDHRQLLALLHKSPSNSRSEHCTSHCLKSASLT